MGGSDEDDDGPERRQQRNADLRAEFNEIGKKVTDSPILREADMRLLYQMMRDIQLRGLGSHSPDLLRLVREEHADELNPAMLALLDSVLGRG